MKIRILYSTGNMKNVNIKPKEKIILLPYWKNCNNYNNNSYYKDVFMVRLEIIINSIRILL